MKSFDFFKKIIHWDDSVMQRVEEEYQRGGFTKKQYEDICLHFVNQVQPNMYKEVHETMKPEDYEGADGW